MNLVTPTDVVTLLNKSEYYLSSQIYENILQLHQNGIDTCKETLEKLNCIKVSYNALNRYDMQIIFFKNNNYFYRPIDIDIELTIVELYYNLQAKINNLKLLILPSINPNYVEL